MQARKTHTTGKRYSIPEIYRIAVKAFRSMGDFRRGRKSSFYNEKLQERIMLAITAVNDCSMCSFAHTEMALKSGISAQEIQTLLRGEFPEIQTDEVKAVLFAQHYADTRGNPSRESWDEIVRCYGLEQAKWILSAARIIMLGNSVGIVLSSLQKRLKRQGADPRSRLTYEISVLLLLIFIVPIGLLHALIANALKFPLISFK